MAYSCKSAALLSDHALDSEVVIAAEKFGYHFGLAFQARHRSLTHTHELTKLLYFLPLDLAFQARPHSLTH